MKHVAFLIAAVAVIGTARAADDTDALGQWTTSKTVERYVPNDTGARVASIELRAEATINGPEVTLKQVCRWSAADDGLFGAVADLVVLRIDANKGYGSLTIEQIQGLLRDAGLSVGGINCSGSANCTVSRSDVQQKSEGDALRDWAKNSPATPANDQDAAGLLAAAARNQQSALETPAEDADRPLNAGDLRSKLIIDVSTRLNIPVRSLQVDFKPEDRKLLSLAAPFEFAIEPQRVGDLGDTSWIVTIATGAESKRVRITANARAWVDQIVLTRPLGMKQTIEAGDIETKHVLADKLTPEALANATQAIGQQAARELRPGVVLTGKMIAPVDFVRAGQLVTVHMRRGIIDVKSVAVALQAGANGQRVRVKNQQTSQVYDVTLTGPQTAVLSSSDPIASVAD